MAPPVTEAAYNRGVGLQPHVQRNHSIAQGSTGDLSLSGGKSAVQEARSSSISRTTSSKRSFRQGFLNWVAFERSLAPNISDEVKQTCPVADCEVFLGSEPQMRQHLKACLYLQKGYYRCHETNEIEQIGKCETKGCRELQQYKGMFSNAMHTLGRRLSPRGCRPSRLVNKISKKSSKSPHFFGVDPRIPYLEQDCDSTMENSDMLPGYTATCSEWPQRYAVELGSGREAVELDAHPGFAELSAANPTTTSEDFVESNHIVSELGVTDDDSTQVSQFLAHGTYQPAELYTVTDSVIESQNDIAAQNFQVDGWDLTPLDYATTPEDLLNRYCSSSDLSMTDDTMDAPCQKTLQSSSSSVAQSSHCIELVSPVDNDSNDRYSSTSGISPMGSFTESDMDQANSVFSASTSCSSNGTSVSIMDPIKTPPDSSPALISFLNEPDRMFQDPIEDFEPLESTNNLVDKLPVSFYSFTKPDERYPEPLEEEFHLNEMMSMSTDQSTPSVFASSWSSEPNPITDQTSPPSSYFSNMLHEEFRTQCLAQFTSKTELLIQQPILIPRLKIPRKPVAALSSRNDPPINRISPDIDCSAKVTPSAQPYRKQTRNQCEHCLRPFTDRSNLLRHIKYSCKKRPDYNPDKKKRPFKCNFGNCKARFTQHYNRLAHQKKQRHLPSAAIALLHQSPLDKTHHSLVLEQGQEHARVNQYINLVL